MTRKDSTDQNNDINWNEHPLKDQLLIETGSIPKTARKTQYTQMDKIGVMQKLEISTYDGFFPL